VKEPHKAYSYEVEDEEGEGVWGYLLPIDACGGTDPLVLRRRTACPVPKTKAMKSDGKQKVEKDEYTRQEAAFEETKQDGKAASGYLIGRHPECGEYNLIFLGGQSAEAWEQTEYWTCRQSQTGIV
jgi:serine/threonine-protein kinase Chk2